MSEQTQRTQRDLLGSKEIRRMLTDYVRRRVPDSDVDDVVQTVLMEALASETVPSDKAELRKWLTGVARHKIADLHRKAGRERPTDLLDIETAPAPVEEQELARWAEKQALTAKGGGATLRWMAREGEGDKLEHIAEEEKLPAATVRQRVSRMRRWMRERWLAELAAAAAAALLIFLVYKLAIAPSDEVVQKEPSPPPTPTEPAPERTGLAPRPLDQRQLERARELRRAALGQCEAEPRACLEQLDEAKRLDPAGDTSKEVQDARERAEEQLSPQQMKKKNDNPDPEPTSSARGDEKGEAPPPPSTARPVAPPTTARPPTTVKPQPPTKAPPPPFRDSKKDGSSSSIDHDPSQGFEQTASTPIQAPPPPAQAQPQPQQLPSQPAKPTSTSQQPSFTPQTKGGKKGSK